MLKVIQAGILLFITLLLSMNVFADEMRDALFNDADDAFRAANTARSNILSPQNYAKAASAYKGASDKLKKGQSIEGIRKDLEESVSYLRKALDATRIAEVTLARGIGARADAEKAQAKDYAATEWNDAEQAFAEAASRLEDGNIKSAQREVDRAEKLYHDAELIAIKTNYLSSTRELIEVAKKNKAKKYAPATLANAESLLSQAEKALSENRYDIDQPRALAREAKYEAQHANHIALLVTPVAKKKATMESLVLSLEEPIVKISGSLDSVAELDGSIEDVSLPIREKIALLQKDSYELSQRRQDILALESEIVKLESRLGMQSERLQKQEQQRKQFENIERMFTSEEAVVLKHGSNVLIRMVGLNFKSGSSNIDTEYFALLKKVQRAINTFPEAKVTVEGHTDSFGGDDANIKLSKVRAEAVRTYLLANMSDRKSDTIAAEGFGETRPIANNETPEGRTKNRRIDLMIQL